MKKLIKILALIFAITLTLSLCVACGETPPDDPKDQETEEVLCDGNCSYTITEWFDTLKHFPKTLVCDKDETHNIVKAQIEISTADELMLLAGDLIEGKYIGTNEISIAKEINMAQKMWTPIDLRITNSSRYSGETLTIDGRNNAIKNLTMDQNYDGNAGIFGEVSGEIGLVIKNLTLDNAKIYGDVNDVNPSASQRGVGAFIGLPRGIKQNVQLANCVVKNSLIKGGHWVGGLIGYARKEVTGIPSSKIVISIEDCSLTNTTIESVGSAGGFIGHAGGCENVVIESYGGEISDCTITCTGSSKIKAGAFVGTVGRAQVLVVNMSLGTNTIVSGGQENAQRIFYGRFGDQTDIQSGTLEFNNTIVTPHVD